MEKTPSDYSDDCFAAANRYIHDVYTRQIDVGNLERLAVERHVRLYFHQQENNIRFDDARVDRVFRFFSVVKHTKGSQWARQQFVLSDWQCFIILVLFGWLHDTDDERNGLRLYRLAYIQVARKNGKSTFAAGIALYLLVYDHEDGAEIYSAATKLDQARIVHREAVRMVQTSPQLRRAVTTGKGRKDPSHLAFEPNFSTYEPVGADSDTLDGLNPHGLIIDELHAHKARSVWDVLNTATGARLQSLLFAITTAGNDEETICGEQRDYAEKVLEGTLEDPEYFAYVCEPDKDDDWTDPATWRKGNPNLGVSVRQSELESQCRRAQASVSAQNDFMQKRLDMWVQQSVRWLNMEAWKRLAHKQPSLIGRTCYGGLDLSSTQDVTAFVLVFPPTDDDPFWRLLPTFWVPETKIDEALRQRRAPYDAWVRDGHMKMIEGNTIDYDYVRQDIGTICEPYDVREIGYDPWNATQIVIQLIGDGFEMVKVRQGFHSLNAPSKEFERLIVAGDIIVSNNPVLKWMASNVSVARDPAGNIKPDKTNEKRKIDGIVSSIIGLGRAIADDTGESSSVYSRQRLLTLGATDD